MGNEKKKMVSYLSTRGYWSLFVGLEIKNVKFQIFRKPPA